MFGMKKKSSAIEPKTGEQYITMNEGLSGEYKVKVLKRQPKGWTAIKGAMTAPRGYIWVSNNKSLFGGERKTALIKDKGYPKDWEPPTKVKILGQATVETKNKKLKKRKAVTQEDLNLGVQNFIKVKQELLSGEARNIAFKKPMRFYREHSVDEAVKLLKKEATNRRSKH